jgi:16S rRNA (guanine(1405)-N(7))-methyltransferase
VSKSVQDLEKLVAAVLSSSKYEQVEPEFIRSLGVRELTKRRSVKETVKAVKNKLHQVGGAYQTEQMGYQEILDEISTHSDDPEMQKSVYIKAMRRHASTRERLAFLEEFYTSIFTTLPPIRSILDVACGLNPLAYPWMPLPPGSQYLAVDIYRDLASFLQAFFQINRIPGQAWTADVIESTPQVEVDIALVLKSIPCLEQVDSKAGERLLDGLKARFLLVSFPAQSLGGREKGMPVNYSTHFQEIAAARSWEYQRFDFPSEIAFLVKK